MLNWISFWPHRLLSVVFAETPSPKVPSEMKPKAKEVRANRRVY